MRFCVLIQRLATKKLRYYKFNQQGENMKRYYLELNGVFVKDSNSLKIITRYYEEYHRRYKDSIISVYDKQIGEYLF